jgi:hypothetical protein
VPAQGHDNAPGSHPSCRRWLSQRLSAPLLKMHVYQPRGPVGHYLGRCGVTAHAPEFTSGARSRRVGRYHRSALGMLALLGVLAGLAAFAAARHSVREDDPRIAAALALVVGWSFIASGLVAWRHRPGNRLGPVMVMIGFAWLASYLRDLHPPLLFTTGVLLESAYLVGFIYLILSFPSGRLTSRIDRGLFAAAITVAVGFQLLWMPFARATGSVCQDCPRNSLLVARNDSVALAILDAQRLIGVTLSLFTTALLIRRWRCATPPRRRAVAPVLWSGGGLLVALAFSVMNDVLGTPLGLAPRLLLYLTVAVMPIAVLIVLLRRRLAQGAVASLVVELRAPTAGVDVRASIAHALRDDSLQLAYWAPTQEAFVDETGAVVPLVDNGETTATVIERDGEPIAALLHDPALSDDPELIDSVCAAAAIALENARLQADLRARLRELESSRRRITEAAEEERT